MSAGILAALLAGGGPRTDAESRASQGQSWHVSQTPPATVIDVGGAETVAGRVVNEESALESTGVWACVRILAETVASLPLHLYRRRDDRGKDRATDHPLYQILHAMPNPEMSAFELKEALTGHLATWGNGYAEIETTRGGDVAALWPLRPDRMRVAREGGRLWYYYTVRPAEPELRLPAARILHLRGFGSNGIMGYSPIMMAKQAIGLALATEEFGGRFFGNGAEPGGVLQHPGKLSQDAHDRMKRSWNDAHQGLERSHRISILEEGVTYQKVGIEPEAAQFLQTRKFQLAETARMHRIPLHMLGDLDRATFSNIEQQSLEFVMYTMMPWFVRWEQGIYRSLLTRDERQTLFAEFLIEGLLRGDIQSRYQAYAQARQNGWLSANDIRDMENMNPVDGGDVYLVPLNMIPATQAGLEPTTEPGPVGDDGTDGDRQRLDPRESKVSTRVLSAAGVEERGVRSARARHRLMLAHQGLYRDVAGRIVRREIQDVRGAMQKMMRAQTHGRDVGSFSLWLEEFYRDHVQFVGQAMRPLVRAYGEVVAAEALDEVGQDPQVTPEVESWMDGYVDAYAARHAGISEARIREVIREALAAGIEPADALDAEFETWAEARPAEIARWESVRFNNALSVAIYAMAGVALLRWVASGESCDYCNELNGQEVGIKSWFVQAGTVMQPNGARPLSVGFNAGHPPLHDGCDCLVVAG